MWRDYHIHSGCFSSSFVITISERRVNTPSYLFHGGESSLSYFTLPSFEGIMLLPTCERDLEFHFLLFYLFLFFPLTCGVLGFWVMGLGNWGRQLCNKPLPSHWGGLVPHSVTPHSLGGMVLHSVTLSSRGRGTLPL